MIAKRVWPWLSTRVDVYVHLLTALCLNVPVLSLALMHNLEGVPALSYAGAYAQLVFVGYYGLLLAVLISLVFLLTAFSRSLAMASGAALMFLALSYVVIDSFVHRIYRFHIDAFWLGYVINSHSGMGVTPAVYLTIVAVLALIAVLQWALFRAAGRLKRPALAAGFAAIAVVACLVSQAIHVLAYYRNDSRITSITPQLPFYSPVVSYKNATRYDDLAPDWTEPADTSPSSDAASLRYPLHPVYGKAGANPPNILLLLLESWRSDTMDSLVSPNIYALSKRSSVFLNHLSSGNSTPYGVFGLFYGLHPTYWKAVKANNAAINNPVLIDMLQANHYALGIYADSQFGRHKIKDAMFRGIEIHEAFSGTSPDARDADLTDQLIDFMEEQHGKKQPFFGFAFYKSTHYSYSYPGPGRFQPARELNIALAGDPPDPTPYVNDYRNSVFYTDSLVGHILARLEASGLMKETIVIVTSDHGEEFNDNRAGWWGHAGNFTRYQTQVPLVFYMPGRPPRQVTETTAHVDVPTTLLTQVFGCRSESDWSNGRDLFTAPGPPRPFVVSGYVNHAFIMGNDVHAVYPMFVQSYTLSNINAHAGTAPPELARQVLEETHRFYQPAPVNAAVAGRVTATPVVRRRK